MNITLRPYRQSDSSFLERMLYEAVYWRRSKNTPSFEEAILNKDFLKAVSGFGNNDGDLAIIAEDDSIPCGAVWIRYWDKEDNIRGYISPDIPILAIAVDENHRRMGVGEKLLSAIKVDALKNSINKISLCASKDNFALNLYIKSGFVKYKDIDHSFIMLHESSIK